MADITSRFVAPSKLVERQGVCLLVYGAAGSGKTVLCTTAPSPTLIISAEGGLLSIRNADVKAIEVKSVADINEIYDYLYNHPKEFQTVCLDSVSEVSEVVLANEKEKTKDPRQAYGTVIDEMMRLLRQFRDLPMDVVMTAKQERLRDEGQGGGSVLYMPSMVGAKLPQAIPYLFDEVFALRVDKNDEGETTRWLQTEKDWQYEAKDRSGALDQFEVADLSHIFSKVRGGLNKSKTINKETNNDET
jgi:phage nucleotide-binding protein